MPFPSPPPDAPRILIAEDDASASTVLRTLLVRVGYQVELAETGEQALRMLDENPPPDILLLDWMLPEVSGLEICYRVRQRWDAIQLPILMVTAKTDAESISAAFDAGASDYLTKPFLGAELRARIAAHLRVKQLVEERRRMDEHLMERQKLSALGLLVSGVAHDLNNPLAGIGGYAQLILEDEDDPEKIFALRRILSEVQRCNRIVGDLLSFARRNPSERAPLDVGAVLRNTVELRQSELMGAGIRASVEVEPELPAVHGDAHQLQQVFLNIVLNAEQAMREGGDTLQIRAYVAPPRAGHERWVQVSFHNNGPPIPPELLPHIFDPFVTTKGKDEGTGLGLTICQRIVRNHGGDILVESAHGGTTFRVLLPADGAEDGEQEMGDGE